MTQLALVTGATGFVGRQIVRELQKRGIAVRAIIRRGKRESLLEAGLIESVVETQDVFLESADWFRRTCAGVDICIHAAWYAEPGKYLTSPLNMTCLAGTLSLAIGAIAANVRRFIGLGTCAEYDQSFCRLDVCTPLKPTTPYAAAKAASYLALSQAFAHAGVSFSWCRLFYLYGESEDHRRLVPYVRQQLAKGELANLTSGNQIRDFMEVTQAASRIVDLALSDSVGAHNVCSGVPVTIRQFVEAIADKSGGRHLLRFGTRPENLLDPPCVVGVPSDNSSKR